jgi:hypothetical protein
MKHHFGWIIFVLICVSGSIWGAGLWQHANAQAGAITNYPTSSPITIPYTGHLVRDAEQNLGGKIYNFHFAIYVSENGGTPLWSETQENILLQDGWFQVNLGKNESIPETLLPDISYWLEIAVKEYGEAEYTLLSPRQRLSSTVPSTMTQPESTNNGMACPHDHFGEEWIGIDNDFGLRVLNQGDGAGLHAYALDSYGVWGETASANSAGVYGSSSVSSGTGVLGYSPSGAAIKATGSGRIVSEADSVLFLSPHDMVTRGSSNVTLTPLDNGGIEIHSISGSEDKYFSLPVTTFGTLFGSTLYVKSLYVCYMVGEILPSASIGTTGVYKNDGGTGWDTYLEDNTSRYSKTRSCYTVSATTPRQPINNSTWAQFNIKTTVAPWTVSIYTLKLTLTESAN